MMYCKLIKKGLQSKWGLWYCERRESQMGSHISVVVLAGSNLAGLYITPDLPSSGFAKLKAF